MPKLLFVNACINRGTSRTYKLARSVVEQFPDYDTEELVLENLGLKPLDSQTVSRRTALAMEGRFDDPVFDMAHKLASADIIVIATPFWENCFNSMTKVFMEYSGAVGVAFKYSEAGMPVGLCRAKALYYVTTRGGPVTDDGDLGYQTYRSVALTYGIRRVVPISASGLDIVTNDAELIMDEAIDSVPSKI